MSEDLSDRIKVYVSIENFNSYYKELNFGEFKIVSLKQGSERKKYKQKLNAKNPPAYILIIEIPNYIEKENDNSGYVKIIKLLDKLLLFFRLFKPGDIVFNDILIEDLDNKEKNVSNKYPMARLSSLKYNFKADEIKEFNKFRKDIERKQGFNNKFYQFALNYFTSGVNKGFSYKMDSLERIVDYIISLESLFLIDGKCDSIRRTISERISKFLEKENCRKLVKNMYNERCNIVHGNNIELTEEKQVKKISQLKEDVPKFEDLIRKVFIKLFDYDFSDKKDMITFLENKYKIPDECFKIMNSARNKCREIYSSEKSQEKILAI